MKLEPSYNGKLARRLAQERQCIDCNGRIEESRFLFALNRQYALPVRCSWCKQKSA